MRSIAALFLASSMMLMGGSVPATAQMSDLEALYADKPLMIVRYNKPRVYISKSLDRAVGSAEKVKENMLYKVVAYVPETTPVKTSRSYLRSFVEGIRMNGVPVERIAWQTESTMGKYPEIHLYVQ